MANVWAEHTAQCLERTLGTKPHHGIYILELIWSKSKQNIWQATAEGRVRNSNVSFVVS